MIIKLVATLSIAGGLALGMVGIHPTSSAGNLLNRGTTVITTSRVETCVAQNSESMRADCEDLYGKR